MKLTKDPESILISPRSVLKNFNSLAPKLQQAIRDGIETERCARDPVHWLLNYTRTFDEHWKQKGSAPYARFPRLPYMPKLFELMQKERRLFLPKSRDMMVSWSVVAYGVHLCQFNLGAE